MAKVIRGRALTAILTIWAAITLAFFMLQIIPGNAVINQMLQGGATEDAIQQRIVELDLDQPVAVQYMHYIGGILRGDFGYSAINAQPVSVLIAEQIGSTIALALSALVVAGSLGMLLGAVSLFYRGKWQGWFASAVVTLSMATPIFWTGTLAIFFFSTRMRIIPALGTGSPAHLLLPALILGFHMMGSIARVTQTSMNRVRNATFVRTARAKGLAPYTIYLRHILQPSLPPIISMTALQTGFLLGGTVIVETLFARGGIGQLLYDAVLDQDYPVVLGVIALSAITYAIVNTLADILIGIIDPRLRAEEIAY